GSASANQLEGGNGSDLLRGLGGADVLMGGAGTDTADYTGSTAGVTVLLGTGGIATGVGGDAQGDQLDSIEALTGSSFGDRLGGNAGNNVLRGAGGADTLSGGAASDIFLYGAASDSFATSAATFDQILDFTSGTDQIVVSPIDAIPGTPQDDAFVWRGATTTFSGGGVGSGHYFLATVGGVGGALVEFDVNGNGVLEGSDMRIFLAGVTSLLSTDFIL
ncbi:MAG: calcium-binding protein, partial [Acetobacteraceae bacterium]